MKKNINMSNFKKVERLCEQMRRQEGLSFAEYCRIEGISFTRADNLFYAYFGMSGDEFLSKMKDSSIVIAI